LALWRTVAGDYLTASHGLPSNQVRAVTVDEATQRVWVITDRIEEVEDQTTVVAQWLSTYDGRDFVTYNPRERGLPAVGLTCLRADSAAGGVWLGTEQGL
jgi:ligand-binding sensor domain-containing protein